MDTRATASHLRENFTNPDVYTTMVNSSINLFNQYVKQHQEGLKARGESTDDLMTNLFKAYLVASDGSFVRYIYIKKDTYDDGGDITVETLMTHAKTKNKILRQQGSWNAMSPE
eukprot:15366843-Ditylum_brightwellii.AAC.1